MFSEVFEIFSGGVGIISVVLSLCRGIESYLGIKISRIEIFSWRRA